MLLHALDRITTLMARTPHLRTNIIDALKYWAWHTLRTRLRSRLLPRVRQQVLNYEFFIKIFVRTLTTRQDEPWLPFTHIEMEINRSEFRDGTSLLSKEDLLRPLQAYIGSGRRQPTVTRHDLVVGRASEPSQANPAYASFAFDSVVAWAGRRAWHPEFVLWIIKDRDMQIVSVMLLRNEHVMKLWNKLMIDHVTPGLLGLYERRDLEMMWDSFRLLASALTSSITQGFQRSITFDGRPVLFQAFHDWAYWDSLVALFGGVPYAHTDSQQRAVLQLFTDHFYIFYHGDGREEEVRLRVWQLADSGILFWSINAALDGDGFFIATSDENGAISAMVDEDHTAWFHDSQHQPYQPE